MNKYTAIFILIIVFVLGAWVLKGVEKKSQITDDMQVENETSDIDLSTLSTKNEAVNMDTNINSEANQKTHMQAIIKTNKGDITVEFFEADAPNTVANFKKLVESSFYNGVKFHRVIKDFMNQAGDPNSKDDSKMAFWGTGGPGYKFADEINKTSDLYTKVGYQAGILAMANSGPNTNGSQFFIMAHDYPLPPLYTIFGRVISGMEVVTTINNVETDENDRPLEAVVINSIELK